MSRVGPPEFDTTKVIAEPSHRAAPGRGCRAPAATVALPALWYENANAPLRRQNL
jgi:hypothetical protein